MAASSLYGPALVTFPGVGAGVWLRTTKARWLGPAVRTGAVLELCDQLCAVVQRKEKCLHPSCL